MVNFVVFTGMIWLPPLGRFVLVTTVMVIGGLVMKTNTLDDSYAPTAKSVNRNCVSWSWNRPLDSYIPIIVVSRIFVRKKWTKWVDWHLQNKIIEKKFKEWPAYINKRPTSLDSYPSIIALRYMDLSGSLMWAL